MASYLVCRSCGRECSPADVATASSMVDAGWVAIVCHACGHVANVKRRDAYTDDETVITDAMLGMLAINVEARQAAIRSARRIAEKARTGHDRRYATKHANA